MVAEKKLRLDIIKSRARKKDEPLAGSLESLEEIEAYTSKCFELIKADPYVEGAEVGVSLNVIRRGVATYSSAMPSDVVETKSKRELTTGIRIVCKDGKIGHAASRGVLTKKYLKHLLKTAKKGRVPDPDFVSLPVPIEGEETGFEPHHDGAVSRFGNKEIVELAHEIVRGALDVYDKAIANGSLELKEETISLGPGIPPIKEKYTNLAISADVTAAEEKWCVKSTTGIDAKDQHTMLIGSVTTGFETASLGRKLGFEDESKARGRCAATHLKDFNPEKMGASAAKKALELSNGKRIKSEEHFDKVLVSPQALSEFMAYVSGMSLNIFMALEIGDTMFPITDVGKQVISKKLSIYDDPTIDSPFSRRLTSEGLRTEKTELIKDGGLKNFVKDTYYANKYRDILRAYGMDAMPRNGFKEYEGMINAGAFPRPTFTNLVVEGNETRPLEEMISNIKEGERVLLLDGLWYTYPTHEGRKGSNHTWGSVTSSSPAGSCMIEKKNGKIVKTLIKPNTFRLYASVKDILSRVEDVSTESELVIGWASDHGTKAPWLMVSGNCFELEEVAKYVDKGTKAEGNYA